MWPDIESVIGPHDGHDRPWVLDDRSRLRLRRRRSRFTHRLVRTRPAAYPGTHHLEINGTAGRILIEDTVASYTFSASGDETRNVWTAWYFNDPDRAFHTMFERYLDDMVPAFVSGAAPPVHARAGAQALRRHGVHRVADDRDPDHPPRTEVDGAVRPGGAPARFA